MATDKNFIVKHGLEVGGVNIVDSSGILSQSLITSVPSGAVASTQSVGDSSTALATTAYVRGEIDALINSAPGTLNTLDELAAAINDDAAFNTTLTNAVALKAPLASPTFTGNITVGGTVDGIDIAARDAVLTSTTTTANAALPKAGGTMTGTLTATNMGQHQIATTLFAENIIKSSKATEAGGYIRMASSTQSVPTYTFVDDTNTGMFTSGADTLNFTTAGTERMRIDSSGNVGIGENNPKAPGGVGATTLTLKGTSFPQWISVATGATANSTTWRSISRNSHVYQIQTVNDAITSEQTAYEISRGAGSNSISYQRWFAGTTEAMRITSTGEIVTGGLTSSTGQLHLYKADATGGKLVLQSQVASDATAKISMMSRLLDNSNKTAYIEAYRGNINFGGESGYGKVGIGTSSPNLKLHVEESTADTWIADFKHTHADAYGLRVDLSGTTSSTRYALGVYTGGGTGLFVRNNGNVGIGTNAPYGKLELKGSGNEWDTAPAIRMWDDTNSKGWFVGTANNTTPGDFYIRTLPSISTNPSTSNQEFTIKHATGNVGIGTTSPQNSAKVDIYSSGTSGHFNGLQIRRPNSAGITSAMQFTLANNIMVGKIQHDYVASNHNDMSFHLRLSGGSNQEVMRFYSGPINGTRVGIGVTVPTAKLHVAGTLLVTDVATINRANGSVSPPSTSNHSLGTRIELYNSSATSWYALGIESNTMWFQSDGKYKFYVDAVSKVDFDDSGVVNAVGGYKVNGTTAIDSNGIVAHVGTTAPSSPSAGKLWFDTTSGIAAMKVYNGAAWDRMSNKLSATGGTTTAAGGYKYHTFTSSGTFTAESAGSVDILVVGGGGAAGWYVGGGGGAGGMIESTSVAVTAQAYSIVIGAGASITSQTTQSPSGSNTTALGLTAIGGGGGGIYPNNAGAAGGSGGGAGGTASGQYGVAKAAGTSGQGNAGGHSSGDRGSYAATTGAGGGGANGVGGDYPGVGSTARTTDGGAGKVSTICPDGYYYAGGGGGGAYNAGSLIYAGFGGIGGGGGGAAFSTGVGSGGGSARNTGGTGASGNNADGGNGGQNTGGGSGGGGHYMASGNNGGSGIVIIRYPV